MKRILFYTNQFFGQIGGEDKAYYEPVIHKGIVGSANSFAGKIRDAEIIATMICGDNYYVENMDTVKLFLKEHLKNEKYDMLIAGPAFNAGRFGVACADICSFVKSEFDIEAITGLYEENPAVEMYRKNIYIIKTDKSAAGIRKAVPKMASFASKLLNEEKLESPENEGYFPKGIRVNVFKEKNGAERALEMLLKKIKGEEFVSEVPIPVYDIITPAEPIRDLSKAKLALLTTGGIVKFGNPDRLPAATAKHYKNYNIEWMDKLTGEDFESVHAGYDPVYANQDPNRVAPLDVLRDMQTEGKFDLLYELLVTTTGNSTSVKDATRMGEEIAIELKAAGVNGVIMTST